ncbi:MAG: hypothetical protein FJW40_08765 [Acidobacteria bacterium]|nr:hypothetical protein [Acidobacteriota bacterium]
MDDIQNDLRRLSDGVRLAAVASALQAPSRNEAAADGADPLTQAIGALNGQIEALRGVYALQTDSASAQTEALQDNTRAQIASAASRGSVAARAGSGVLGHLLSANPLAGAVARLFGGRPEPAPAPLAITPRPPSIAFEGVVGATPPRAAAPRPAAASVANITVQVQALDSRSFVDRRDDIARAVREAMLESHALNDVISEI